MKNVSPTVPTLEDVIALHDEEIARSGDAGGILNRGSLEAALDRARHGPFEGPGSVLERGGLLLRGICQDHPFADGNKRTAFAATHMLLERNGIYIRASAEEVRDFMLRVARIELDLDGIVAWMARFAEIVKEGEGP